MKNSDRIAELNEQLPTMVKSWKTPSGQTRRLIRYKGKVMSLEALCRETGVSHYQASNRLKKGMSIDDAVRPGRLPLRTSARYELDGKEYSLCQLSAMFGINDTTLHFRLQKMPVTRCGDHEGHLATRRGGIRLRERVAELEAELRRSA
jgi:hypothetical protein